MSYPIRGGSGTLEFQEAWAIVLQGDQTLKNMVTGGFYDGTVPPEFKVKTPYVLISNCYERANNRLTNVSRELTVELEAYSSYAGKTELANITNRIILITEEQQRNFVMNEWVLNKIAYEGQQFFMEGGLRRVIVRFVATMEPKE